MSHGTKPPASMMVALQARHGRDVTRIETFDGLGVEVETPLPLEVGDALKAQLRVGGPGGRLFSVAVEVTKVVRGTLADAARVRLEFTKPDSSAVRQLGEVAARRGLFTDPNAPTGEKVGPVRAARPAAKVTGSTQIPAVVLRFRDVGERRKAIRETLNGALFVRSSLAVGHGTEVICRFVGQAGRSVCVLGRVQFASDGTRGPEGFGLTFTKMPPIVQTDLRRMR